jgi:(R,R)-butanediol dehydrogenase/meso-butanediol dehydrogenase/diacetyl reductase
MTGPGTMKAAVYHGARDVRIDEVPIPRPRAGEVLLAVQRSGICGTDATEWSQGPVMVPLHRRHPASGHIGPLILGHEFVGEVVDGAADDLQTLPAGTLVATGAGVSCGRCDHCTTGRTNICRSYYTLGLNAPGGLAEFVTAPVATLRSVPAGLSVDAAAMAQPLAVGLHAARRAGVRDGDSVVIVGGGAIGTFVLAGLTHLTDADITLIDLPGPKLDRAARHGATRTLAVGELDVVDAVRDATGGRGADVVIEASGAPGQYETAVRMTSTGGRILAVGLPKSRPTLDIVDIALREIVLDSTVAHICDADLAPALDILADGTLGYEMLDAVIGLDDLVERGLAPLSAGKVEGKILVSPSERTT